MPWLHYIPLTCHLQEMSSEDRALVEEMDTAQSTDADMGPNPYEAAFNSLPPGEEGFDLSHKGGEHRVFEEFAQSLAHMTHM